MSIIHSVVDLDDGWKKIKKGITKLEDMLEGRTQSRITAAEKMELYSTVNEMCYRQPRAINDYPRQLHAKFLQSIQEYIVSTVLPSLKDKHDEVLLRELLKRWKNHKVMVKDLCCFFLFLDEHPDIRSFDLPLNVLGLSCFRVLVYSKLNVKVRDTVISLIDQEREGRQIDRTLLKDVLQIYDAIGGKSHDFEAHLLKRTAEYYSTKPSSWIVEYSCLEYLLKAEECLKRETDRRSAYLHSCSLPKLLKEVQRELLFVHGVQQLKNEHSGCRVLFRDNKVEDLSRMYRLFCRIPPGMALIVTVFKQLICLWQHVIAQGMTFFQQAEDEDTTSNKKLSVREVIAFHNEYLEYVNEYFKGDIRLCTALKEAFEVLCNKFVSESTTAELLATLCDDILKGDGNEKLSDEAIEAKFEKLLACIRDKDLFVEFYRRKLARRLLLEKGANEDHERIALSKIKQHFGGPFIVKLEGMLKDLILTRENTTEFDEYLTSNPNSNPGIEFTVTVLTTIFWPSCKPFDPNLPPEMAAALVLFNTSDRLSYSEIKTQLSLSDEEASRLLHSLSRGKYKILTKKPSTNAISSTYYFEYNAKFTVQATRIKLPSPAASEKKKVFEDADKARSLSIVRIMKSRKVLSQQEISMECAKQLSHIFKPEPKAITKRIEDLVYRDYLQRDKDDPDMLKYLP